MLDAIRRTLNETKISPGPRVVLEAAAVLFERSGSVSVTAEALKAEIAARVGQPISDENFRKRLSRLNDALDQAGAPFSLHSVGGMVTVQPNARYDAAAADASMDKTLHSLSAERAVSAGVTPRAAPAKPAKLFVMFSYAWLNQHALGKKWHQAQVDFYEALASWLERPPEKFDLPPIELWRDVTGIDRTDQGHPQLDEICRNAFLCVIMMSNRYWHRPDCLREAAFFLTEQGENQPGKRVIIVPVNVQRSDVPERFSVGARIWRFDEDGKTLIESEPAALARLVKAVAEDIFKAAQNYLAIPSPKPTAPSAIDPDDEQAKELAWTLSASHDVDTRVPPRAAPGTLTAQIRRGPAVMAEAEGQPGVEIVPVLADWACSDEGPRLTALLGEFGMGKTVTCRMLNRHLLTRRETEPSTPLSLYFDLRDIEVSTETGPGALEKIIGDLVHRAGTTTLDAKKVIDHIRKTACFVIFDGIDEVTNKLSAEQAIRFYRELLTIVPSETWQQDAERRRKIKIGDKDVPAPIKGPRILVSCRSHYFRDLATQRGFLTGLDRAGVAADEDIQTYFMLPFTDEQIEQYLNFHLGDADGARAWELIGETYNLKELAERPILLRFITETFSQLEEAKRTGQIVNIARLYDIFVDQSFTRDEPKHIIPIREKRRLLTDLAAELHRGGLSEFSHSALEDWFIEAAPRYPRLAMALSGTDGLRLSEIFLQDLRNATLLVRPSDSGFRFGHTSIREYFLADAIVNSIAAGIGTTDLDIPMPSPETLSFILARLDIEEARLGQNFNRHFPALLAAGSPRTVRVIAFTLWQRSDYRLLRPSVLDLTDLDFFNTRFTGTAARRIPLHHSRWQGARLNMVEFEHVDLTDADFSGVDARMAHILSCRLDRTLFRRADLQGTIWRHLDASSADFTGANLRDAHGYGSRGLSDPMGVAARYTPLCAAQLRRSTHMDRVTAVAFGKVAGRSIIVSGSDDKTVRLWDAESGNTISILEGHESSVTSLALGEVAGRNIIVSGSDDKTVRLWDAESGNIISILEGHESFVTSVALGEVAGRSIIVSGSDDNTVRLWDAESGNTISILEGHEGLAISVALGEVAGRSIIVSGSDDNTVRLWDAESGNTISILEGHKGSVISVALGEVAGRSIIVSGSGDNTVRLWDAESGNTISILEGHESSVTSVALGKVAGRSIIVSGSGDNTVRLWDAESGNTISILEGHEGLAISVALGEVAGRSIIVSRSNDETVRLWDAESGNTIGILERHEDLEIRESLEGRERLFISVALGEIAGRSIIVSCSNKDTVRLWDAESGNTIRILEGHKGFVTSVALGEVAGRSIIVSGSNDYTVRLWDAESGSAISILEGHEGSVASVALGEIAGRSIIVSGSNDYTVRLWDAESGNTITILEGHSGKITSVALGEIAGRSIIVSGSDDYTVRLWDAESGNMIRKLEGHRRTLRCVALGEIAGRGIIVSGNFASTVQLWDAESGKKIKTLIGHERFAASVALGEVAGRHIIVSGSDDYTVRLWDAESGNMIAILEKHSGRITSVALGKTADGIVIASTEESILHHTTLNPHTFAVERRLILGPGPDTRIETAPAPDGGDRIISASDDAWRYWRVQGRVEGRLVMRMVDDVLEPDAARA